jgi:phosphonate transport system permease protein
MRELAAYPTTLASPAADRQGPALADRDADRHLVYLVLAVGSVEVNWARVYDGLERGQRFIMGFLQPDFTSRWRDISQGLVESLTMTLTSTVVGVAISIPIGIGAARNIAPR